MSLIPEARAFAIERHTAINHVRKYTGAPYTVHLERVAAFVEVFDGTTDMIAAAWLHDVVEDTPTTLEEIRVRFGEVVADLVRGLTDVYVDPEHGNRAARKAKEAERLGNESAQIQTIKLADLIDNTHDIAEHDPKFAKTYLLEKARLLGELTQAWPNARVLASAALRYADGVVLGVHQPIGKARRPGDAGVRKEIDPRRSCLGRI